MKKSRLAEILPLNCAEIATLVEFRPFINRILLDQQKFCQKKSMLAECSVWEAPTASDAVSDPATAAAELAEVIRRKQATQYTRANLWAFVVSKLIV